MKDAWKLSVFAWTLPACTSFDERAKDLIKADLSTAQHLRWAFQHFPDGQMLSNHLYFDFPRLPNCLLSNCNSLKANSCFWSQWHMRLATRLQNPLSLLLSFIFHPSFHHGFKSTKLLWTTQQMRGTRLEDWDLEQYKQPCDLNRWFIKSHQGALLS